MKRSGHTLIELLALAFVMGCMLEAGIFAARYGIWSGIGAAFCAGLLSVYTVVLFYRWTSCLNERSLQEVREKYREVYRVVAAPTEPRVIALPKGAEIRVGDYGWEAGPSRNDGLIYLHGLTLDWTVVWHAGLHPEEIEKVGTKPHSQYDSWYPDWAAPPKLPPCPFPVIERETMTLGRPHYRHHYFVELAAYHPRNAAPNGNDTEMV